jgi:anaerobic selenocysteine-containing dehydrogenase
MLSHHSSACPLDCPDACSLEVRVEEGKITRIDGSTVNPLTGGYICAKVRRFAEHLYSPERLLYPAARSGKKGSGQFERISWKEALERVTMQFQESARQWGAESILPFSYGGSNGLISQDTTDARLFFRLGASRLARTVCSAPTRLAAEGLYGRMPTVAVEDYLHARLIVLWGVNPSATGIHLVPIVQQALERGAKLIVVDPRTTPLAARAHLHLPLRPGTDLPLALGIIRWLFENEKAHLPFLNQHATGVGELRNRAEPWTLPKVAAETGLSLADLESLAQSYAAAQPAVIRCGWGQERNRNGGSATAAILALPAVGGKFGVRGGGYTLSNSSAFGLNPLSAACAEPPATREINMNLLGETLLGRTDPPVKVLFVYNANPLSTLPCQEKVRQGLEREDLFTIVFEQVMTDTAAYADLLLPATTFLERRELSRGYGAMVLQDAAAVVAPEGESRSNHEVFAELCRRLGLTREGEPETDEAIAQAILAAHPRGNDYRQALTERGVANPPTGYAPIAFVDYLPWTPDQKIHLFPQELDREARKGLYAYEADPATSRYPLSLISPATGKTVSSMLGQTWKRAANLEMHPDDARARGIAEGDAVLAYNELGEVEVRARLSTAVRPGVVVLPKGLWSRHTLNGATSNALSPDTLSDIGGGACFNDARVEVRRARTSPTS